MNHLLKLSVYNSEHRYITKVPAYSVWTTSITITNMEAVRNFEIVRRNFVAIQPCIHGD